ncbi:MAG: IMP dehydrogenase, partial [Chloroflexi bacterium]|nr:IMP dehydrogenase [Chloroflexota bacterium]
MRIETDLKLGFKDVLIRPKRSTLKSRAQVVLDREFTFLHSQRQWSGIPIITANMDTVGTFETAEVLAKFGLLTALHKHYSLKEWDHFLKGRDDSIYSRIMINTGTAEDDFNNMQKVIEHHPKLEFICIDVANGYVETFVDFVKQVRDSFPDKTIVSGNVVTGEMVEELLLSGADIVKVGIGPGSVCT